MSSSIPDPKLGAMVPYRKPEESTQSSEKGNSSTKKIGKEALALSTSVESKESLSTSRDIAVRKSNAESTPSRELVVRRDEFSNRTSTVLRLVVFTGSAGSALATLQVPKQDIDRVLILLDHLGILVLDVEDVSNLDDDLELLLVLSALHQDSLEEFSGKDLDSSQHKEFEEQCSSNYMKEGAAFLQKMKDGERGGAYKLFVSQKVIDPQLVKEFKKESKQLQASVYVQLKETCKELIEKGSGEKTLLLMKSWGLPLYQKMELYKMLMNSEKGKEATSSMSPEMKELLKEEVERSEKGQTLNEMGKLCKSLLEQEKIPRSVKQEMLEILHENCTPSTDADQVLKSVKEGVKEVLVKYINIGLSQAVKHLQQLFDKTQDPQFKMCIYEALIQSKKFDETISLINRPQVSEETKVEVFKRLVENGQIRKAVSLLSDISQKELICHVCKILADQKLDPAMFRLLFIHMRSEQVLKICYWYLVLGLNPPTVEEVLKAVKGALKSSKADEKLCKLYREIYAKLIKMEKQEDAEDLKKVVDKLGICQGNPST